jgi:hypothetical protein
MLEITLAAKRATRRVRSAHNPEVAGSNPAPATKKVQVRGMITELGGHALFFVVNQWSTNSAPRIAP